MRRRKMVDEDNEGGKEGAQKVFPRVSVTVSWRCKLSKVW
jgi:hypothetical protein